LNIRYWKEYLWLFRSDRKLEGPLLQNPYQNRIIFSSRSKQIWQWYGFTWAYGHLPREFDGPPSINYFSILFPFVAILLLLKIQHKATICYCALPPFLYCMYMTHLFLMKFGVTGLWFYFLLFLKIILGYIVIEFNSFSKTVFFYKKYNLEKYAETITLNK
jgi:hypothetical protein